MKALILLLASTSATSYLNVPRGSNNRLREKTDVRENKRRLFLSNNNERGGYNVGETTKDPAKSQKDYYEMKYFQSGSQGASFLTVEWMQSTGCGVDELGQKLHDCKIVLQTMCQDEKADGNFNDGLTLRNGFSHDTQAYVFEPRDIPDPGGKCYNDFRQPRRDLTLILIKKIADYSRESTVDYCRQACATRGYLYAGIQSMRECRCGNSFGIYGEANPEECIYKCRDKQEKETSCGGFYKQNIYLAEDKPTVGETRANKNKRRSKSVDEERGLHEPWEFYDACVDKSTDRYGLECSHERQNYPVTYPTPWLDVAVYIDDVEECSFYVNQNHRPMYQCIEHYTDGSRKHKSQFVKQKDCEDNDFHWLAFYHYIGIRRDMTKPRFCDAANRRKDDGFNYHWGRPLNYQDISNDILSEEACLVLPSKAKCFKTPNTRPNYLGNVDGPSLAGEAYPEAPRFHWQLPRFPDKTEKRCVFRLRTIIENLNEPQIKHGNEDVLLTTGSIENIDTIDSEEGDEISLTLAVANKHAQNNRVVFEDRSHVFRLLPRPDEISSSLTIHNIVVRGKRGNIVQTHPAVEYDFVPNRLDMLPGEAVQIQWTGSNTHDNNGNGRGDNQSGDDGNGKGGTDRSNFIQMIDRTQNWPAPFENHTLFHNAQWVWASHSKGKEENKSINLSLSHTTSGYYQCLDGNFCEGNTVEAKAKIDDELDNVSPSFQGHVFIPEEGKYFYKCLRNDNFSNRSQKGEISVRPKL